MAGRGSPAALLGMWCGLAAGCGNGTPGAESSRAEAVVTGRVDSPGKPIDRGTVVFDPSNINRPGEPARTAPIGRDGTYRITTRIGEDRVAVAIPGRRVKDDAARVQQVFDVKAGQENVFQVTVP
ncbi:hypothetical protein OJF2_42510 [Aquisphaera giovannonii]|uniref:Carboxypeptidase regulatory-like domain-containing protein n=1 Tax=Aquisphaera giovannonii TaxID=406548 RepID=A0A5B9W646_9BACT|nr:hypothetical protein [Aquisphaera giovannonii]QEH35694.1 hypothetical protein OJF2_42510 [Aquisphaera giovannonii]